MVFMLTPRRHFVHFPFYYEKYGELCLFFSSYQRQYIVIDGNVNYGGRNETMFDKPLPTIEEPTTMSILSYIRRLTPDQTLKLKQPCVFEQIAHVTLEPEQPLVENRPFDPGG
jgi:hypothetical protein